MTKLMVIMIMMTRVIKMVMRLMIFIRMMMMLMIMMMTWVIATIIRLGLQFCPLDSRVTEIISLVC